MLASALALPPAARAETDCGSLDIALDSSAGFSQPKCDSGSFAGGGPSRTEEVIVASGPAAASVFIVHHAVAGIRTYFNRVDTRAIIDDWSAFARIENWAAAPGGNQFAVARFNGRLKDSPDLPLACMAFSRYTSHVARSTGFRHLVYGFYCSALDRQISDAEVRRLIDAIKFSFE